MRVMKMMKFQGAMIGLLFIGSVFFAGPAAAERGHRGGKMNPEKIVQRLTKKLNLDEVQASQVKVIFDSHQGRLTEIREQMKSTFTDDQRSAMKERRKNRKRGGERPTKEERQAIAAELGISQGQRQQMKSLRGQMIAERQALRTEIATVLSPEQQAQFEQMKQRRRGKRGQRGRGGQRQAE